MTDNGTSNEYDQAHADHNHDTFVITLEDMGDAARLQQLLSRASQRTESSSRRVDRLAAGLGEAFGSHDQVRYKARQLEYDIAAAVFDSWLAHQDRLIRQLAHLDMVQATSAANTHSAAMVHWTKVLAAVTAVLALATIALIWATLAT